MHTRKSRISIVSGAALIAMTAGFAVGILYPQWPQNAAAIASHPLPAVNENSDASPIPMDGDAAALHDMNSYAVRHLGVFEDDVQSFDGAGDWSARWYLRWKDVHVQGGTVRIYHVTDKQDDRRRFATMWSSDEAPWERAW